MFDHLEQAGSSTLRFAVVKLEKKKEGKRAQAVSSGTSLSTPAVWLNLEEA